MQFTGVMVMTTTATDCVWSFLAAAGAQEAVSVGSVELLEADMGLHPDAQSTGSLCRVSMQTNHLFGQYSGTYISFGLLFELLFC